MVNTPPKPNRRKRSMSEATHESVSRREHDVLAGEVRAVTRDVASLANSFAEHRQHVEASFDRMTLSVEQQGKESEKRFGEMMDKVAGVSKEYWAGKSVSWPLVLTAFLVLLTVTSMGLGYVTLALNPVSARIDVNSRSDSTLENRADASVFREMALRERLASVEKGLAIAETRRHQTDGARASHEDRYMGEQGRAVEDRVQVLEQRILDLEASRP